MYASKTITKCNRLYHKIVAFIIQFGHPPVLREMCVLMNTNSTSLVRGYLKVLEEWRWIEVPEGKCRAIQLIRPTERGLTREQLAALFRNAERFDSSFNKPLTPEVAEQKRQRDLATHREYVKRRARKLQAPPAAAAPDPVEQRRSQLRAQIQPFTGIEKSKA